MKSYSSHGIIKQPKNLKMIYNQKYLGFNYRLSDIHASLGISQLLKINKFISNRNKIAKYYIDQIEKKNSNKLPKGPKRLFIFISFIYYPLKK